MIFIDNDNTLGSKAFTQQLATLIRPVLAQRLDDDELDDFDLALLQDMVHLADLSGDDFNAVIDVTRRASDIDADWQQRLLKQLQADPRHQSSSPA